eukprot:gnl/MRDRNA2_/MRDRNA2_105569_c0_seq1.p1 gnl/MRDRNA2_/MRDRNA2_105569_c0~~gnl/MRDRNA2_/MRDRNA2_105569_c0_seq1.p1  ORF type:complete len:225 (+),score=28.69 gnl/MRDRNA2_/MRDRNA2_105569_c0_seq1:123-797(+)
MSKGPPLAVDPLTVPIGIVGTGMMATGIGVAYVSAGLKVVFASRDQQRGRNKVAELMRFARGQEVAPSADSIENVLASCPILVLAIPTRVDGGTEDGVVRFLEQYGHLIRQKGKVLIDITYYGRSFGRPTPPKQFFSALQYHSSKFNDPSTSWVAGYKSVMWTSIRDNKRQGIEIAGDERGRATFGALIAAHGFTPLDCGGIVDGGAVIEPGGPRRKPHPGADV